MKKLLTLLWLLMPLFAFSQGTQMYLHLQDGRYNTQNFANRTIWLQYLSAPTGGGGTGLGAYSKIVTNTDGNGVLILGPTMPGLWSGSIKAPPDSSDFFFVVFPNNGSNNVEDWLVLKTSNQYVWANSVNKITSKDGSVTITPSSGLGVVDLSSTNGGGGGGGVFIAASSTVGVITNGNVRIMFVQGILTNSITGNAATANSAVSATTATTAINWSGLTLSNLYNGSFAGDGSLLTNLQFVTRLLSGIVPAGTNGNAGWFFTLDANTNPVWAAFTPGAPAYNTITSGQNTSASMTNGSGSILTFSGSGLIIATWASNSLASTIIGGSTGGQLNQNTIATNAATDGLIPIASGPTFRFGNTLPALTISNVTLLGGAGTGLTNLSLPTITVSGNPLDFTNNATFGPWTPNTKTMGLQEAINALPLASSMNISNGFGGGTIQIIGTLQLATNIWLPNTNPFHLFIKGTGSYKSKVQYTNTAKLDMFVVQTNYPRSFLPGRTLTLQVEDVGLQYLNNNTNYIFNLWGLNTFASKRCFYFQNFYANGFVETDPTNIPAVVALNLEPAQSDMVESVDDKFYNLAAGALVQCDHALFVRPMFYNIGAWYSNTVTYATNAWPSGIISSCAAVINSSTFADVNVESAVFVNCGVAYYSANSSQPNYYPSYLANCRFDGVLGSANATRVLTRDNSPVYIKGAMGLLTTDSVATNDMFGKLYASSMKPARVFSSGYHDLAATRVVSADGSNNVFSVDYSGGMTNAGFASIAGGALLINPNFTYATNMYVWGAGTAGVNGNYYRTNSISDASSIEWTNPASGDFFLIDPDNVVLASSVSAFLNSSRTVLYGWGGFESAADPFSLFNVWYDFTTNTLQGWGGVTQFTGSRPLPSGAYISIFPTIGAATANLAATLSVTGGVSAAYLQAQNTSVGGGLFNGTNNSGWTNFLLSVSGARDWAIGVGSTNVALITNTLNGFGWTFLSGISFTNKSLVGPGVVHADANGAQTVSTVVGLDFGTVAAHTLFGNQNSGTAQPGFGATWQALDDFGSTLGGVAIRTASAWTNSVMAPTIPVTAATAIFSNQVQTLNAFVTNLLQVYATIVVSNITTAGNFFFGDNNNTNGFGNRPGYDLNATNALGYVRATGGNLEASGRASAQILQATGAVYAASVTASNIIAAQNFIGTNLMAAQTLQATGAIYSATLQATTGVYSTTAIISNAAIVGATLLVTNAYMNATSAPPTATGGNVTLNATNGTVIFYTNATFNLAVPTMGPVGLLCTSEFWVSNSAAANINVVPATGIKVIKPMGLNSVSTCVITNGTWGWGVFKTMNGIMTNFYWYGAAQ